MMDPIMISAFEDELAKLSGKKEMLPMKARKGRRPVTVDTLLKRERKLCDARKAD